MSGLWKRYTSPLAWAVWLLLEIPAMLFGTLLSLVSRGIRWCALLWIRHVYYVFTRLARWVDGKPGWREADRMIGVLPPTPQTPEERESAQAAQFDTWWRTSVERGRTLLTGKPLSMAEIEALSDDDRTAIANAIVSMGGSAAVVDVMPRS